MGTNGSAYLGGGYGELPKYRAGLALNNRKGKFNFTGGLNYNRNSYLNRLTLSRVVLDQDFDQFSYDENESDSYSARLGLDYDLNDRHRLGFNARTTVSQRSQTSTSQTNIFNRLTGEQQAGFATDGLESGSRTSFSTDAFYRWKIDTSGQEVTLDGSYSNFSRDNTITLITNGDLSILRRNQEPALIDLFTSQIDYKRPIGKTLRFEAGVKYSSVKLDNELLAELSNGAVFENDPNLSNKFLYDENIAAAYGQFYYEKEGLEIVAGLRLKALKPPGTTSPLTQSIP
ncbi:MAG: outer membrane beta-barrel protein [Lewinella sp.]|nr:outer membrane beta-barrel protein [Lewinella sp.]